MFKSTTTKIFLAFSFLVGTEAIWLSYNFAQLIVKESKRSVFETLLSRSQLAASQATSLVGKKLDHKKLDEKNIQILNDKGELLFSQLNQKFAAESLHSLIPLSGSIVTECLSNQGERFFCAISPIEGARLWVFDYTTSASLGTVIRSFVKEIFSSAALLVVIALLFTYLLSRFLLLPLRRFSKAADLVAKGEYDSVQLPTHRKDEIGHFAFAFEKMIADLKERETNLKVSAIKLAHSARLASIGQMGASIAHEVKNPLTAMMGYAKVLKSKAQDSEILEAAEIIQKEADRCNQILQQMLRFARNDPAENKPYAIKDVIQSVELLVKAEAKSHQITLKVENSSDAVAIGSPQQIQQVLINLLMNAFHASPASSFVTMRVRDSEKEIIVEVEDQGIGIPKEVQPHIFEPFFTTKPKKEGTGLGLSVAQEIVHNQKGDLSFESIEGKGTTFQMRLPLA